MVGGQGAVGKGMRFPAPALVTVLVAPTRHCTEARYGIGHRLSPSERNGPIWRIFPSRCRSSNAVELNNEKCFPRVLVVAIEIPVIPGVMNRQIPS